MATLPSRLILNGKGYAAAVVVTALATLTARLMFPFFHPANLVMIYLLGVVVVATRYGRGPSVLASVLSVAAFDFFFVHPYLTFVVTDTQYLVTFVTMLIIAILISTLTTNVQEHAEAANKAKLEIESERLRNALLSSLSHDLRTPLSTITGATESLLGEDNNLTAESRKELLQLVYEEARRMNRFVNNLLDMTRLEFGSIQPHKEWLPIEEVIGSALNRLDKELSGRQVRTSLPDDFALVPMDGLLIEQVFVNLLENTLKHTPAGTPIEIAARWQDHEISFEIADRGPGFAPGEEKRVFEKFYRGQRPSLPPGAGLGLTICKGIVAAHGGSIEVANRPDGGAIVRFALPVEGTPPRVLSDQPDPERTQ